MGSRNVYYNACSLELSKAAMLKYITRGAKGLILYFFFFLGGGGREGLMVRLDNPLYMSLTLLL